MKTVIIRKTGGPEVLQYIDAPDPVAGPGEVVVRAHAMGVGWPDILIRKGVYNWMPPLPASPGSEMSGRIEAIGPEVSGLSVGQEVLVSARELPVRGGCYAEQIAVPADTLHLLPPDVDLDEAAGLGNFQVAWGLLRQSTRGFDAKSVLITGAAGGVGGAVVQLARHMGMLVIGTVSSDEKAAFAKNQGADHLINYCTEDVVGRVMELTDGRGLDLVLDHVAGPAFADNFKILAPWGTVVSFGDQAGPPPSDVYSIIRANAAKCLGVRWFSMHVYDNDRDARRNIVGELTRLLADGAIRPRIAARLPLAQAADAQRMVESGKALGRVILKP